MEGLTIKEVDALCRRWRVIVHNPENEFKSYSLFLKWSKQSGYDYGKVLEKIDKYGPYSPANCRWTDKPLNPATLRNLQECIKQWDDFASPIRERYKAELDEIERREPKPREFFRYEHPDLVREGIEWKGN